MRILVAEDDARLADFLCEELQRARFAVQKVADGVQAQELASNQNYDLVILDLTLPGVWGLDILGGIRSIKPDLPVLIITGLQNWKSASVGWMLERTTVSRNPSSSPSFRRPARVVLQIADLEVERVTHAVHRGGHQIALSPGEDSLLEFLMRNAGLVTRLARTTSPGSSRRPVQRYRASVSYTYCDSYFIFDLTQSGKDV